MSAKACTEGTEYLTLGESGDENIWSGRLFAFEIGYLVISSF